MGEQTCLDNFMRAVLHGDMIRSCHEGGKVSPMHFLAYNLSTINLKIFPSHGDRHT